MSTTSASANISISTNSFAVGLREEVLDADVVYFYWGDTLTNHYSDAKPVLDFLAKREKNKYTYADLHELNAKWVARKAKATG